MFALLDAHNFYAACEGDMRPALRSQPYAILSANDGAVVARSELARALGVKMGEPWFKLKDLRDLKGLIGLSANFTLYSDYSTRMHSLLSGLAEHTKPYSVDESFSYLGDMRGDHTERVWRMRERIGQWLGLPMGGGIGKTLTLAKLASHISKQAFRRPGTYPAELAHVCNLGQCAPALLRDCMANTPVNEVWGIGRRYSAQLIDGGILTALDLANMDAGTVRARWGVNMERTVRELNGIACIDVEGSSTRQQIMCSRSLAKPVDSCRELQQLASLFASNAARKLRQQGSVSKAVSVFAMSSPFRDGPRFARSRVVPLPRATDDSRKLCDAAAAGMQSIFEQGYDIVKVGVMLMDISSREAAMAQGNLLFDDDANADDDGPLTSKEHALMQAVDAVNERYGRHCLRTASTTVKNYSRQELRTPHYTTNLRDAPIARA